MAASASNFYTSPTYQSSIFDLPKYSKPQHPVASFRESRRAVSASQDRFKTHDPNSSWNPNASTYENPLQTPVLENNELALARAKLRENVLAKHAYGSELRQQAQARDTKRNIEKILDLTIENPGVVIGEVNEGIEVGDHAKNLRIRENVKKRQELKKSHVRVSSLVPQSLNTSFAQQSVRSTYREGDALNMSCTEQFGNSKAETDSNVPRYSHHPLKKKREESVASVLAAPEPKTVDEKKGELEKYLQASLTSKFGIQRLHHQRLKEDIVRQVRRFEDYTTKVLTEQQSQKQGIMKLSKEDIAQSQDYRSEAVRLDKEAGKNNKWLNIENYKIKEDQYKSCAGKSANVKEVVIDKVIDRPASASRTRGAFYSQSQPQKRGLSPRKVPETGGSFQRILQDTIKRREDRKTKVSQASQPARGNSSYAKNYWNN